MRLGLSSDGAAAQWIDDRMDRAARTIGGVLPRGFEAYARVLHPASADGRPLSWAEVIERTGKPPLTPCQWFQDIADSADESGYDFTAPRLGEIPDDVLRALMPTLLGDTSSSHGWFCLWEGWAFVQGSMSRMISWPIGSRPNRTPSHYRARPAFDSETLRSSRLPWRDYLLFEGRLEAIGDLGATVTWDPLDGDGTQTDPTTSFERQTPSLFWPDDHSWCAANDIEASFTCIGGAARLIDALYDNTALEVAPVV